jgi:DNA-binding NtrC family response regulator
MGQFQVLAPGADRPAAEALMGRLLEAWHRVEQRQPPEQRQERRPTGSLVVFPEEAASSEFLFEALRDRLAAGSAVESAALESDERLQQVGVTAMSPAMREVYRTVRRVAPTDLTILLEGETGTGKEVLTNLIHRWSKRAAGPLVKVHCAALSETLLVSELFGHEKGAFTGADRRRVGKFEQAHGGTIFLDEVGDMPMDVQVKLLRVLQEREIDRVGGSGPVAVDVRVIAATNHDIGAMVAAGRFREDLYYRLQGVVVRVPPLRERRQEIAALVEHFRREVVSAGQSRVKAFSTDAMDELFLREWPGNVRELRNVVFRAMVLASGDQVELRDLRATPAGEAAASPPAVAAAPEGLFELPRPLPEAAAGDAGTAGERLAGLPERIRALFDLVLERGEVRTLDHMQQHGVSHRTALRDLQMLVDLGFVERLGKRRAARYRPRIRSRAAGDPAYGSEIVTDSTSPQGMHKS